MINFISNAAGLIAEHEGFRSSAYRDSEGFLTIGYGTMIDERKNGGITRPEAAVLLHNRLRVVVDELNKSIPWWNKLDEVRCLVLVDMAYNLGVEGLLFFHQTLKAVENGDWEAAARGMEHSLWYKQVGRRSVRLVKMMRTGQTQTL